MNLDHLHDQLNPANLRMLQAIADHGSFAAAARELDLVPSALSYRVRQLEDALDVLLFNRQGRRAIPTAAGLELLQEGARLLTETGRIAQRVRRIATGWESHLSIVMDNLIDSGTVLELCQAFFELGAPTRIRIREEVMSGTLEALSLGQADLAIGVVLDTGWNDHLIEARHLGDVEFVYAVASSHPLAAIDRPLTPDDLLQYRAVAVADSASRGQGRTVGLLAGQDVLAVPNMATKITAQLCGIGVGHVPLHLVQPHLDRGALVRKELAQEQHETHFSSYYAWHRGKQLQGQALQWWLQQLDSPATQCALLAGHQRQRC